MKLCCEGGSGMAPGNKLAPEDDGQKSLEALRVLSTEPDSHSMPQASSLRESRREIPLRCRESRVGD
jgi:hypothetical protein